MSISRSAGIIWPAFRARAASSRRGLAPPSLTSPASPCSVSGPRTSRAGSPAVGVCPGWADPIRSGGIWLPPPRSLDQPPGAHTRSAVPRCCVLLPETRNQAPGPAGVGCVLLPEGVAERSFFDVDADEDREERDENEGQRAQPVVQCDANAEERDEGAGVAGMAEQPVGPGCDDPMAFLDHDYELEQAAEGQDRPCP